VSPCGDEEDAEGVGVRDINELLLLRRMSAHLRQKEVRAIEVIETIR